MRRFWMATRTTSDVARLCPIGTRLPSFEVPSAPQLARSPSSECSAAFRIPYKGEGETNEPQPTSYQAHSKAPDDLSQATNQEDSTLMWFSEEPLLVLCI
jgi:hypothetical protein